MDEFFGICHKAKKYARSVKHHEKILKKSTLNMNKLKNHAFTAWFSLSPNNQLRFVK